MKICHLDATFSSLYKCLFAELRCLNISLLLCYLQGKVENTQLKIQETSTLKDEMQVYSAFRGSDYRK